MKNTRAMKDLSLDERRQILLDYETMPSRDVREKWNISLNVLSHIRFFHGKSNAKVGGYYHKSLVDDVVDPRIERIKEMKIMGETSDHAAKVTGIPLDKVNRLWPSLPVTKQ